MREIKNKPIEWFEGKLSEIVDLLHGYQFRSFDFTKDGIPVIKIGNVIGSKLNLNDTDFISENRYNEFKNFEIKNGDILMSLTGNIGRVIEVKNLSGKVLQNYRVGKFVPVNQKELYKPYIKFLLSSDYVLNQFFKFSNQSAQANFGKHDMDKISVVIPKSLPEQQKIAEILSTVDEKIELIEAQINQTTELKKSLMQQLLTKGIGHTKFKDSPLGKIPESWEVVKLDSLGKFSKGKGITKSQLSDDGLPCIRYGEIYTVHHYVVKDFYSFIPENIANESVLLEQNDLIFAGSGETIEDIGKCVAYIFNYKAFAGGDTIIFKPQNANSIYLSYYLNSDFGISQRRKMGQGNAVVHIYSRDLSNLIIVLPPKNEQDEISRIFLTVDEKLDSLTIKREYFNQMKKGLMQQLLTGKLRVNVNTNLIIKN